MTKLNRIARAASLAKGNRLFNWFPGHMYSGRLAMIGKLNTVDCVIEVHDARIPLIGRNREFKEHLGAIKPRLLVLNKSDLADLSQWESMQRALAANGDSNVILTDLSGKVTSFATRGYTNIMQKVIDLINTSDRFNRAASNYFQIMIVGIPNVGKSTLINRLRQQHLGLKGNPAKAGSEAGVTKHVDFKIKVCVRPPVYMLDTPGVLMPQVSKNTDDAFKLALCSTVADNKLPVDKLVNYLLDHYNKRGDDFYLAHLEHDEPVRTAIDLYQVMLRKYEGSDGSLKKSPLTYERACWDFIKSFRLGRFGRVMFS